MRQAFYCAVALLACATCPAQRDATMVYPTHRGTTARDYSKPGYRVETDFWGNRMAYPTLWGTTSRDYSKPGYRMQESASGNGIFYPTHRGTTARDYSKPGYRVETDFWGNRMAYPTLWGTSSRDYSKPGYRVETGRNWGTAAGSSSQGTPRAAGPSSQGASRAAAQSSGESRHFPRTAQGPTAHSPAHFMPLPHFAGISYGATLPGLAAMQDQPKPMRGSQRPVRAKTVPRSSTPPSKSPVFPFENADIWNVGGNRYEMYDRKTGKYYDLTVRGGGRVLVRDVGTGALSNIRIE